MLSSFTRSNEPSGPPTGPLANVDEGLEEGGKEEDCNGFIEERLPNCLDDSFCECAFFKLAIKCKMQRSMASDDTLLPLLASL